MTICFFKMGIGQQVVQSWDFHTVTSEPEIKRIAEMARSNCGQTGLPVDRVTPVDFQ
jgi:hypothetical protein